MNVTTWLEDVAKEIYGMAFVEPSGRAGCVSATIDSKVLVWGGTLTDQQDTSHLKNIYILDTLNEKWTSKSTTGEHPRGYQFCCSAQSGNVLYVYGGLDENDEYTGSLFSLNLDILSWRELSPHVQDGPRKKHSGGMIVRGEKIILFGGFTEDVEETNELHIFDLSTGMSWKYINYMLVYEDAPFYREWRNAHLIYSLYKSNLGSIQTICIIHNVKPYFSTKYRFILKLFLVFNFLVISLIVKHDVLSKLNYY